MFVFTSFPVQRSYIMTHFLSSPSRWPPVAMREPTVQRCLGPNVYPEVPDGGWGWAVAAAFFVVEVCSYGTLKSLGVFLQDLMKEFGETNSRVSWVISICVFIFTFTGKFNLPALLVVAVLSMDKWNFFFCPFSTPVHDIEQPLRLPSCGHGGGLPH